MEPAYLGGGTFLGGVPILGGAYLGQVGRVGHRGAPLVRERTSQRSDLS